MAYSFTPKMLLQTKENIEQKHRKKAPSRMVGPEDGGLRELINQLVSFEDEDEIMMMAYSLEDDDVLRIAGYIPFNYDNVDMTNLFTVVKVRMTEQSARFLYHSWTNSYEMKSCNHFLRKLCEENQTYRKVLNDYHISRTNYIMCLDSDEVPLVYGGFINEEEYPTQISLQDKLAYFGVDSGSKLYKECEYLYYLFCKRNDFLMEDKARILSTIRRYGDETLKKFMINFLSELSLADLMSFSETLIQTLLGRIGEPRTEKSSKFFSGVTYKIVEKYANWINAYLLDQYFDFDERSRFWKQYKYLRITKYDYRNQNGRLYARAVVMETEKCYISEFITFNNPGTYGKAYFYDKEVFVKNVRYEFVHRSFSDVKSILNNNEKLWIRNQIHYEGWQYEVANYLRYNNITEKLFE